MQTFRKVFRPHDDAPVALTGGWARPGRCRPSAGRGALIGPDGLAVRWTGICCACGAACDPTAFWDGHRRVSTMFRPPAKKACEPRMRGQRDVGAHAGAAQRWDSL
jgi:hypothetical protein